MKKCKKLKDEKLTEFQILANEKLKNLPNKRDYREKFKQENERCATKYIVSDETLLQFRLLKHPPVLVMRVYDKADNLETIE